MTTYQELVDELINKIIDGDNVGAQDSFNGVISAKMGDALEAKKMELAQSVYGREPQDDLDIEVQDDAAADNQETKDEHNEENR